MNTRCRCEADSRSSGGTALASRPADNCPQSITFIRRCVDIAGWLVPGAILAILPKCPVCLAAYVAIGTGIGLSITAATYLWTLLVALCVTSLVYLATRLARRLIRKSRGSSTAWLEKYNYL